MPRLLEKKGKNYHYAYKKPTNNPTLLPIENKARYFVKVRRECIAQNYMTMPQIPTATANTTPAGTFKAAAAPVHSGSGALPVAVPLANRV